MSERVFAGAYRTVRELSADATGRTWLATAPDGEEVVVKVVRPRDAGTAVEIEHDVELVSGIRHPALPTILEWGHDAGEFYVVREYLPGADLKTELGVQGRFAPFSVARIGSIAASALAEIHKRGLVHGNIRTANLLRQPSDEVTLVGAGLGVRDAAAPRGTDASASAAWYLAPELVEGEPPSTATDIYALGAVLYELSTGSPVFDGISATEVLDRQAHATPVPLSDVVPDIPPALDAAIMRALEKAPEARWASADGLAAALDAIASAESPLAPVEVTPARTSRAGWWAAAIVVLLLAALGGAWALGLFGVGGIAVPDVAGKTLPEARAAVIAAGLVVGDVTYAGAPVPAVADGLVANQAPAAGAAAQSGDTVDLVLAGREMISVPDASGVAQSAAESVIRDAGLTVGAVTNVTTTAVAAGIVAAQRPQQGDQAAKGSPVDLWVAQAPATAAVPGVSGSKQADASAALTAAGFAVSVEKLSNATVASGLVIDQAPTAGVTAQVGSTVTIRVSTGPSQTTVPAVTGKTQAAAVNALTAVGFLTRITFQTGGGTVGTVIEQSPSGGSKAATGSTVVITVVQ